MPHLVEPFSRVTFDAAVQRLQSIDEYFAECAARTDWMARPEGAWAIAAKRQPVRLDLPGRPNGIGKTSEKMGEVVNICATIERLIEGLKWFAESPRFRAGLVLECHPSTSDTAGGSDLVIGDRHRAVISRAEVSDVVSTTRDSNAKEASDLRRLGCSETILDDAVARFLITSSEFAQYLLRREGHRTGKHYRYEQRAIGNSAQTGLLEVMPSNNALQRPGDRVARSGR
jgi:hypothetical protein